MFNDMKIQNSQFLLGIYIHEVHGLKDIPQRESKSMRRRRIFSSLDCGQCRGIVDSLRMAIDSPANDWFSTSKAKQQILTILGVLDFLNNFASLNSGSNIIFLQHSR